MKKGKRNKRFVKPRIIKRIKIETRAGWCGINGKTVIGQNNCVVAFS